MKIMELKENHYEVVKDLLVDLQNYVIKIDKYNLNIISEDYREKYFEYMVDDCNKNQGKIFVAVEDDVVLGMIAGFLQTYSERDKLDYKCPQKGIISELIVSKNSRKGGVGTKLLKFMENYFSTIGCSYVQIDVFAYNENAKNFYYKNGYENRMIAIFKKL